MVYDGNTSGSSIGLIAGDIVNFSYSGTKKTLTLNPGVYQLECWGAQGGYRSSSTYGGKGGYSAGTITLTESTTIYIYTGASGNTRGTGTNGTSFNGGGYKASYYGGGDASDIRISTDSLYARVIVAGGGGSDGATNKTGGYGGGTSGQSITASYGTGGYGGTQTGNTWLTSGSQTTATSSSSNCYAGFGFGGNGVYRSSGYGGAGGGGWYGGSGSYPDTSGDDDRGGGGGSGFVLTSSTISNVPSGYLLNSQYILSSTSILGGGSSFLLPTGTSSTGNTGNGYVRITVISSEGGDSPVFVKINSAWESCSNIYVYKNGEYVKSTGVYVRINGLWNTT